LIEKYSQLLVQYYAAAAASMDERVHLKVMLVPQRKVSSVGGVGNR